MNALRPLNKLRAWRWGCGRDGGEDSRRGQRAAAGAVAIPAAARRSAFPAAAARAINSVYAAIGKFIASAAATGAGAGRAV